jgi:hypothetical protein
MRRKKQTKRTRRTKRTLAEIQTAEERRALIEAVKQRRGVRVNFTDRKLNSKNRETGKLRKIVMCSCGQKGVASNALAPSVLVIHRGTLKQGKFYMTEFCVNSAR